MKVWKNNFKKHSNLNGAADKLETTQKMPLGVGRLGRRPTPNLNFLTKVSDAL